MYLTLEEGIYLVRLARYSIQSYLSNNKLPKVKPAYEKLLKPSGAFVTLKRYADNSLRGCIGYPEPILPLYQAVIRAAVAAAFEDPRFPPLSPEELPEVLVEVSVLTPPERIDTKVSDRRKLPDIVKIGEHGIIVRKGPYSGLLLPQVAVEYSWNSIEFLNQTCLKAGLWYDCWLELDTEIYAFSAEIFTEKSPGGEIIREEMG